MVSFSKYKYVAATTFGAICGGTSIYYGLTTAHGYPISKWDPDWDK